MEDQCCGVIKWKFAFQYCDNEDPWWVSEINHQPKPSGMPQLQTHDIYKCAECKETSPHIYEGAGICLRSTCDDFFVKDPEKYSSLRMREDFLSPRADIRHIVADWRLQSPLNVTGNSWFSARGWWCKDCGRLCPRYVLLNNLPPKCVIPHTSNRDRWECWYCPKCQVSPCPSEWRYNC